MKLSARARRWWLVVVFAIGMAWVESACVYYLRVMVDRVDPYQANPLPMQRALGGPDVVKSVLPTTFNWSMFAIAYSLMSAPIAQAVQTTRTRNKS
jgi:hypothetical protein